MIETFKFELGQSVKLLDSGYTGTIIARCEYLSGPGDYVVLGKTQEGLTEQFWKTDDEIEAIASVSTEGTQPAATVKFYDIPNDIVLVEVDMHGNYKGTKAQIAAAKSTNQGRFAE
jgi:hypothetical protein